MTYDKKHDTKRPVFDATKYRNSAKENDLRWRIAQLELVIDELLDVIRPFAEAEIESETNPYFSRAREIYAKRRVSNR